MCIRDRRHDDQILKNHFLVGFEKLIVDRKPLHLALGGKGHANHAAACLSLDLDALHLGLHLLHFCLHGLRLLHQTQHVGHN